MQDKVNLKTEKASHTPPFTRDAVESITMAKQTASLLRSDLMRLNSSLTTEGNDSQAEQFAHDALMEVLTDFARVEQRISRMASIMEGSK